MKGNLRAVSVIGTGMIRFGKHRDSTVPQLARPAVIEALQEAGVANKQIESIYSGAAISGWMAGQRIARLNE